MTAADARAEMEADFAWRQDELRFLQRHSETIAEERERDQFRRTMVLLLYAHFEGYCRFTLSVYVNAINASALPCREANHAIAAATLSDVLAALRHPSSKCAEFRHTLPDDSTLHLFAREREFVERFAGFELRRVKISDRVVDTESNLNPAVLRKILYRLGLDVSLLEPVDSEIHRLLQARNKIAHGETKLGLSEKFYSELRDAAFRFMQEITAGVTEAIRSKRYRREAVA